MKKVLLLSGFVVAMALTLSSCSKEHTCTCTITDSSGFLPTTTTSTILDGSKSDAKTACNAGDAVFGTITTECELD